MLNIAFVGCGRISGKHFDALDKLQDRICVRAVCDSDIERAHNARSSRDCCSRAAVYDSIEALLTAHSPPPNSSQYNPKKENEAGTSNDRESLDAVVIALPNGLHAKVGIQCARAGLHIIMEKPLAIHLSDGQDLVQSCRENRVELFLIHQNRFNPPVQQLHQAITEGRMGRIYSIYANVFWTRPQSYYDSEGAWHGTKEMDGGAFYTQASHYLDMVQWLAGGRPWRLSGQLRTLARQIETEDCGTAFLEWGEIGQPDNLIATINMSMLTYPCNFEGSILILGETGCVKIGGTAMNKVEHWQMESLKAEELDLGSYDTESVYGFGHRSLYTAVVAKLNGEVLPESLAAALVSGRDILDNLMVLEGILLSAQGGGLVIEL
ncbi:Gfo/Idh/MocA family oxidoreductase [Candidatus Haliotispira prima]|uniref:Gfo/Idh/MocA family oxidoreductase n=1 Tax=Candidatus Haliotispira prima TaxID=3034016 RepID=A0ABY8MGR3_9SPIO|nr:Gfo/Idh/MocA family oxidoreductase [Candidatus Haliotispira prima]